MGNAIGEKGSGLLMEILTTVYAPTGYELVHLELPYKRAVAELLTGAIHCTMDVNTNRKGVLQSKVPIVTYDLSVAYIRTTDFKNIQSLKGKKVAYLHGFDLEELLPVKFKIREAYDLSSAVRLLDRGHVDYILGDIHLLKNAILEAKLPYSEFEMKHLMTMLAHPIFTKTAKGRILRDIYDRRMRELVKTGEFQTIMGHYDISDKSINTLLKAITR